MKKSVIITIIIIAVVAIAAIAGGTYYYLSNKDDEDSKSSKKNETKTENVISDDDDDDDNKKEEKKKSSGYEELAEELAKALSDEDAVEDFIDDYADAKAYATMDTLFDEDLDVDELETYADYKKALIEAFEKGYKNVGSSAVKDAEEEIQDNMNLYSAEGLTVKKVGKAETSTAFPIFERVDVVFETEEEEEVEYAILVYNGKLVIFAQTEYMDTMDEQMEDYF